LTAIKKEPQKRRLDRLSQGDQLIKKIENQLEGRLGLIINQQKTQVVKLNESGASLDFLGFTFHFDQDQYGRDRRDLSVFRGESSRSVLWQL